MNVRETVCRMMRSYPTLYRTRVGALIHLFGDSDATWVNGELQLSEQYNGAGNELDDISEQQLAFDSATTEEERGFAARDLAFKLRSAQSNCSCSRTLRSWLLRGPGAGRPPGLRGSTSMTCRMT